MCIPLQGDFDYGRFCSMNYKPDQYGVTSEEIRAETEARKEFVYLYLQFLMGSETTEDFFRKHGFIGDPMNVGDPGDQSPMNHLLDEMTLVLYCNYYIYIFAV